MPEVKAWEVDLEGNIVEVIPLSKRKDNSNGEVTTMAPPNDGFVYQFDTYLDSNPKKNWRYQQAGTFRVNNATGTPTSSTYKQQATVTKDWTVSGSISGNAEIGTSFLSKLEVAVSASASRSKTYTQGTEYGVSQTIPPNTTVYITNYVVGINDSGQLRYKKYSPSGISLIGYYYENAGGTAVNTSDVNIEISNSEPIN